MRLRQVPRDEVQGDDLRPLRRQGDALAGPPQADGAHRAGRPGRPHLVLQGHAQPPGHAPGHAHDQPGADHLLPGLRRRRPGRHAAQGAAAHDRGRVPQGQGAIQGRRAVQRGVPGRHGGRGGPQALDAARPGRPLQEAPPGAGRDLEQAEDQGLDQAAQGRRGVARQRQPPRVDGARVHPGHPAGPPPAGPAGFGQLRHQRLERPLPADHQSQQPAQEAGRLERARGDHPQREADAPAGRRRPVRQQPLQAAGAGQLEPPLEVADRHDQGQAGPVPRKPAGQAGRLLGAVGDRRRTGLEAAPVRAAQEDRPRAVSAVHHPAAQGAGARRHDQVGQEDARAAQRGSLGHPRGGHPQSPRAA